MHEPRSGRVYPEFPFFRGMRLSVCANMDADPIAPENRCLNVLPPFIKWSTKQVVS